MERRLLVILSFVCGIAVAGAVQARERTVIEEVPAVVIDEFGYPVDPDVSIEELEEAEALAMDEEGMIMVREPRAIRERTEDPKRKEVSDGGVVAELLYPEGSSCHARLFSPASEVTYRLIVPAEARQGQAICDILATVLQEEQPLLFVGERRFDETPEDIDLTLTKIKVIPTLPE